MGLRTGILGVGPVGEEIIRVLRQRSFPTDGEPVVMATSERVQELAGGNIQVRRIEADIFKKLDVVFFAGKEGAKGAGMQWGETAVKSGCLVVDNGGDFRMNPLYPLVVPEVNMDSVMAEHRYICNPNCSTIQMVVALAPLHRAAGLRRVVVSTYQSVSGHSGAAMEQLREQTENLLRHGETEYDDGIFSRPAAFDCIPHIDRFCAGGYTKEEMKLVEETRKIIGEPNLLINPTTVRVPVMVGHSESINAEFDRPMDRDRALEILSDPKLAPGVAVIDGPTTEAGKRNDQMELRYPTTRDLRREEYRDAVLVGRVRSDTTARNAINFWCVADNLRKGAATNAVQIAEEVIKRGMI